MSAICRGEAASLDLPIESTGVDEEIVKDRLAALGNCVTTELDGVEHDCCRPGPVTRGSGPDLHGLTTQRWTTR